MLRARAVIFRTLPAIITGKGKQRQEKGGVAPQRSLVLQKIRKSIKGETAIEHIAL
nr:hypothetical protein [uncultured archaeon]